MYVCVCSCILKPTFSNRNDFREGRVTLIDGTKLEVVEAVMEGCAGSERVVLL